MNSKDKAQNDVFPTKLTLNLAIVGGGKTCKFFLELIKKESFPFLNIKILGVCDLTTVLVEILCHRPKGLSVIEHNIGVTVHSPPLSGTAFRST